jgi:hypothetical protein
MTTVSRSSGSGVTASRTRCSGDGDNAGDAGDGYRGSLRFGTTAAEQARGLFLDRLLAEEEPDAAEDDGGADLEAGDRRARRELAQLVAGADGSHSRTDADLIGPDRIDADLSAEEAALHVIRPRQPSRIRPD